MSPPTDRDRARGFIDFLNGLVIREDRAALAALRRGLGKEPGTVPAVYPYIMPFVHEADPPWVEMRFQLIAPLFAWHQLDWPRESSQGTSPVHNLGASLARLRRAVDSESIEQRFVALLNAHSDDLPNHLRHAVGLLKTRDLPIDWAQLLQDLAGWNWESRAIQRAWAKAFWGEAARDAPIVTVDNATLAE